MSNKLVPFAEMTRILAGDKPMTFEFPEPVKDTAAALRLMEPQAPKQMKALLIQAADELEDFHRIATDCVQQLNEAAELRVGQMASAARADEVNRSVRQALTACAQRLAALVTDKNPKGENHVRST